MVDARRNASPSELPGQNVPPNLTSRWMSTMGMLPDHIATVLVREAQDNARYTSLLVVVVVVGEAVVVIIVVVVAWAFQGSRCTRCPRVIQTVPPLANRGEARVRYLVETSAIGDLKLDIIETGVARHDGFRCVIEADRRGSLEGVVDELRAARRRECDRLGSSGDSVFREDVVHRMPGFRHPRQICPFVCVNVVSARTISNEIVIERRNSSDDEIFCG